MGKHGHGTIMEQPDGSFRIALQTNGRRLWRRVQTREKAEERLALLIARRERGRTDGLRAHSRRMRAEGWILLVVAEGRRLGWDDAYLARVIVAQLSPSRIKRSMFGPCVYCGTWIAATTDHVVPRSQGGTDDPSNLVSACWSCNSRKGNRTMVQLPISLPVPVAAEA